MSATPLGANCNVDAGILSPNVVLCAGEDVMELLRAFERLGEEPRRCHTYRCYRFWQYTRFTLIWTGIGTGCIEPLLFEVLTRTPVVQTIVLIGTAGKLRPDLADRPHVITQALLGPAPFGDYQIEEPLTPEFDWQTQPALQGVPTATAVSTDLYYGFPKPYDRPGPDRADVGELRERFERLSRRGDLLEMEVGQFYYLCRKLRQAGTLRFLAVKGPANAIGADQEQVANSAEVLQQCSETTIALLNLRQPGIATSPPSLTTVPPPAANPKQALEEEKRRLEMEKMDVRITVAVKQYDLEKEKGDFSQRNEEERRRLEMEKTDDQKTIEAKKYDLEKEKMWLGKLIEEVKIFWTMQVGIIAALGYIIASKFDKFDFTAVPFACAALALVTIANVYNYVGNYYTFEDRKNLPGPKQQEAIVTPLLDYIHTFLAAVFGAIIVNGLSTYSPFHFTTPWSARWPNLHTYASIVVGVAVGVVIHWFFVWRTYRNLCQTDAKYPDYNRRWRRPRVIVFWLLVGGLVIALVLAVVLAWVAV